MKTCYISSVFFQSLRPSFFKFFKRENIFDAQSYFHKFKASGFERALFTLKMYKAARMEPFFSAAETCIYVEAKEVQTDLEFLSDLHRQGIKILLGGSEVPALKENSFLPIFEEVIFWVYRVPTNEDLDLLAAIPRLRWLFSYNMSETAVQRCLEQRAQKNICEEASRYLELPAQKKMDFWFSPETEVLLTKKNNDRITTSVIIPFQDNADELLVTLKYLAESLQGSQGYELVLVDDSYCDQHREQLVQQISAFDWDIVYLKLKRAQKRTRGDRQFRAGIARNYGAAVSAGHELVFIDSDILLGKKFWSQIAAQRHQGASPLMPKRFFLKSDSNPKKASFEQLKVGEHTQLSWGGHWEDFYRSPASEPYLWKWTSTFCLAIPKNVFFEVGGFRRGFYCYGFEDTDLGYRLHAKGLNLQILDTHVFHLPVEVKRSEYAGQAKSRKKIMKESFKVFQRSAIDPELSKIFRHMIG